MRNKVMFITVILVMISPAVFASIENMPTIDAFNWNLSDDFSNLNYSLNNWDLEIPSIIRYGINADDGYGYLQGDYTTSAVSGTVTPTQGDDICGIRADVRLTSLPALSGSAAYCVIGADITPNASLYWGFCLLDGQLSGTLLLNQFGGTSVIRDFADFDAVIGQTYNFAMVFDDATGEYYLYLNGEKKSSFYFPEETSFSSAHFRMYTQKTYSRFEFDNIEFATVPEPATMLLLGLGGLLIRKHQP